MNRVLQRSLVHVLIILANDNVGYGSIAGVFEPWSIYSLLQQVAGGTDSASSSSCPYNIWEVGRNASETMFS